MVTLCKKYLPLIIVVSVVLLLYGYNNPYSVGFFPRCPFLQVTGFECAGCGSQRALHFLATLQIGKAFQHNPLLVLGLPYLLIGFILERSQLNEKQLQVRKIFYGQKAILLILGIVILFWIGRNII